VDLVSKWSFRSRAQPVMAMFEAVCRHCSDSMPHGSRISNNATATSCVYRLTNIMVNVTSQDTGLPVTTAGYTAFHQCSDSTGTLPCNNAITSNIMNQQDPTSTLTQTAGLLCSTSSTGSSCIDCTEINDKGPSCNKETTTTCLSSYCSKFQGSQGGAELITRGCSPYSPYVGTGCVWISQNISAPLPLSAIANGRRKRSVGLMLEGHQCFCTGDRCNGAGKVMLMTIMPLLLCLLNLFA